MRERVIAACLLAGLIAAAPTLAGTVIETDSSASGVGRILVSDGRLRMESGGRVVLFDAQAGEMTLLDPETRTYNVLDEEVVRRMAQQMEQMRAQLEKQLEGVPEGQREQMRRKMQEMLPGVGPPPGIRVEVTGETASVAGATCREARIHRDDEPAQEVCVADPGELGIPAGDFDTMTAMFGFFDDVAGAMGGDDARMGAREMRRTMDELGGMPARARALQGGNEWAIGSVETRSIADDRFAVPAGYEEGRGMDQATQQ